jgi:hypothetical protein
MRCDGVFTEQSSDKNDLSVRPRRLKIFLKMHVLKAGVSRLEYFILYIML